MKHFTAILFFLICIGAFGCSSVKVTSDFEKTTDFSQYETYSILGWQDNSDQIMSEFDKKRVSESFTSEFQSRNLNAVDEGGDMAISLYFVVNKETSVTAYTNYHGGHGGRYHRGAYGWGGGASSTTYTENDYIKGTLVMDVYDEESGDMIWQGVVTGTLQEKPEKREKSIPKTIGALMAKFPVKPVQ